MAVTLQDVARRAHVSTATVSRVLANKPNVSDRTRQRVLAVIQELGYQPNRVARSLRVRHTSIIGLIISDIENPFFTSLVRAVEDVAYRNRYALFLCNSDEDLDKEDLYIDLVRAERVAGVVISPTQETDTPCQKLIQANIPVVSVDRRIRDLEIDSVIIDNAGASARLTHHLIESGHRRIAAVFGTQSSTTGRERLRGYQQAMRAHHLPTMPEWIGSGLPKKELGYAFARQVLSMPEPPTALYTGNNLLTIGALRAIHEARLHIPQDIALACFDEMEWMPLYTPALTVVAQPTYELGHTATELLLKRIADPDRPVQNIVLQPELYIRESSRAP